MRDSRKFLPVGVLLFIATLAVQGATSKEATIIKDVSFSHTEDSLEAKITAGGESKYTYFELKSPHRLVIDFHGIQNEINFKEKNIGTNGVERVRTSLFSDKSRTATRIVFDLSKDAPFRVIDDGAGVVRIVFGKTARAPQNQTAGPAIVPVSKSFPASASPALKLASLLPAPETMAAAQSTPLTNGISFVDSHANFTADGRCRECYARYASTGGGCGTARTADTGDDSSSGYAAGIDDPNCHSAVSGGVDFNRRH
jgi:hypothetical protein